MCVRVCKSTRMRVCVRGRDTWRPTHTWLTARLGQMKLVVLKHLGMKGKTAAAPQTGSEVIPQLGSMFERDEALMRVVSFSGGTRRNMLWILSTRIQPFVSCT